VSYWVFGFLGNIVLGLLPVMIAALFHANSGFYPPAIFATIIATWTATAVVMTWQLVGVWRSAAVYSAARLARGKGAGRRWRRSRSCLACFVQSGQSPR
jgi:hypothetical protein